MTSPKIFLLVNCFNSEDYLEETLQSLSSLIYDNYHVYIFDNCSTDLTSSISKRFSSDFSNFHYNKLPQFCSLVNARNYALKFISDYEFDYFAFCDSDDLWSNNWLSVLTSSSLSFDLLFSNGYELRHSSISSSRTDLVPVSSSSFGSPKNDSFSSKLYLGSVLFSSRLLDKYSKFLDSTLSNHYDIDLFLRLSMDEVSYIHFSDRLFFYRVHPFNLSSKLYLSTLHERWLITKKLSLSVPIFMLKFTYYYLTRFKFYTRLFSYILNRFR